MLTLKAKMGDDVSMCWYCVDTFSSSQVPHFNTMIISSSSYMIAGEEDN